MSEKIRLKLSPESLRAFNQIWEVSLPRSSKPLEQMVFLIVEQLSTKFLQRSIGLKKDTTLSLEKYEAIALKAYMQWCMTRLDNLANCGSYELNEINKQYLVLDQKTI